MITKREEMKAGLSKYYIILRYSLDIFGSMMVKFSSFLFIYGSMRDNVINELKKI